MASDRAATVRTPLGGDKLTFTHLVGRDEISRPFAYTVGFVSHDTQVDSLKMLGGAVSVEAESGDPKRWFSGFVSEFRLTRIEGGLANYEAVVRPWLWFLCNSFDCRIFQNMTAVEIVEKVLNQHGGKFEKRLQGSYPSREYCVQFDESDLDFVQRLLEEEGIFYFFEHADGEHTMVLADANAKLKPAPGYKTVDYHWEGEPTRRDTEYMTEWTPGSAVRPGAYVHTDYDFKKPRADLMSRSEQAFSHSKADGENYRQPGLHLDTGRGDAVALVRREEIQARHRRVKAAGTTRGLFSGCTFKLQGFPRDDQNAEYLVVSAEYRLFDPEFRAGIETTGEIFKATYEVAPTTVPYRPQRLTRRVVMRGPQTATVVGPSGEEIYTDEYARVKVQFHWDREGRRDQNSSCFVRVSQAWAGSNWGFIQIPRIGQEVIVDFLEGDPDRPIITGRVYNASQMPPYKLPANATQSGVKSRSSKGGGAANFNEFRFEDKKGSEQVFLHAEKDHDVEVENDRTKWVGHDQSDRIDHDAKQSVGHNLDEDVGNNKTVKVGVDQTTNIGSNDTETVGSNRSLTVGVDETISVGSNSTESIGANLTQTVGSNHTQTVAIVQTVTVGAARFDTVGAAETRSVGAVQTNTIGASRSVSVGAGQSHSIGAADSWQVGAGQSVTVGADQSFKVGAGRTASIAADDSTSVGGAHALSVGKASSISITDNSNFKVGKKLVIDVGDEILIQCGSAKIMMKKDGTIGIEGKDISVKASSKINMKASSDIIMKGSKISEN